MTDIKRDETILGIDYGERNIGLAFGRSNLVAPMKTISGKNANEAVGEINRAIIQNHCTKAVVGLPLSFDNRETLESRKVRHFANLLKVYLKVPIEF